MDRRNGQEKWTGELCNGQESCTEEMDSLDRRVVQNKWTAGQFSADTDAQFGEQFGAGNRKLLIGSAGATESIKEMFIILA